MDFFLSFLGFLFVGFIYLSVLIYFITELVGYTDFVHKKLIGLLEILFFIILPIIFISMFDHGQLNDCCTDSAVFSPEHRITLYSFIIIVIFSYFYTKYFLIDDFATPIIEVTANCFLIIGILINILIFKHDNFGVLGNPAIILFLIVRLFQNHKRLINYANFDDEAQGIVKGLIWVLNQPFWMKMPLLIILCLPVLVVITSFLMLFGQKPDSFLRAFTDTYKHGLSQLDAECIDVYCPDGHYLCTIAAKGHEGIVKPVRIGKRNGKTIVCNRQLLISNAFEELIQEKLPKTHRKIRTFYDKIGNFVHRYYGVFKYKFVSDFIYILMKPLEWFFIFVLYLFDKKPENRIAKQYL